MEKEVGIVAEQLAWSNGGHEQDLEEALEKKSNSKVGVFFLVIGICGENIPFRKREERQREIYDIPCIRSRICAQLRTLVGSAS